MTKLFAFFGRPWTLFALSVLSFSLSVYFLTGLLVVWGAGLLIASVARFVVVNEENDF